MRFWLSNDAVHLKLQNYWFMMTGYDDRGTNVCVFQSPTLILETSWIYIRIWFSNDRIEKNRKGDLSCDANVQQYI